MRTSLDPIIFVLVATPVLTACAYGSPKLDKIPVSATVLSATGCEVASFQEHERSSTASAFVPRLPRRGSSFCEVLAIMGTPHKISPPSGSEWVIGYGFKSEANEYVQVLKLILHRIDQQWLVVRIVNADPEKSF